MPPYWTLGFHLCRWGYGTIENLTEVMQRMHDADFPVDIQWTDIDTMDSHLDFTYDNKTFHGLPELIRTMKAEGKHYVNIIDPGISSTQPPGTYPPYDEGLKQGIFITKYNSTEPIVGEVWPGPTVFPDFTNPKTVEWWTKLLGAYHEIIPVDGMWIDMNEPSNFVDGSHEGCTTNSLDNPPFTPHVYGGNITAKTLCTSAQQYLSSHYNLHSMYGYFEAKATNAALRPILKKRPFVLSRSTFAGSGHYTTHWSGDNAASFTDLYQSIPTILNYNIFGMTFAGAEICGFNDDTTEELCTKWMVLGAFYPFMRNHNAIGAKAQDPAVFSWEAQQIMKQALLMRYSLLPYWYTLFFKASTISTTVIEPLFFEYPNDEITYNIDRQFLVGPAILVSPNLVSNSSTVHAYVPQDVWYEFSSGIQITTVGQYVDFDTPIQKINVHIRGGFIIPMQIPGPNLVIGRGNPFVLLVALSQSGNASGSLFWDDGDSMGMLQILLIYGLDLNMLDETRQTIEWTTAN
ncbi:unnamed protein product [Rotaria sordida]|uniref:Uncharacterized protein n=1 Tax=Rotaria sordida TaxID=392033 RepID=A0A819AWR4_9BILA|nr:unnamed protein product [Rotaria sordida]